MRKQMSIHAQAPGSGRNNLDGRRLTPRRLLTIAASGITALACGTLMLAAPAQASTTQTLCGAGGGYVNEAIWQTSTTWGRAGERVCWEYSSTQVRAFAQLRIDWPSDCTLTLGYGAGEVGCPTREFTKLGRLTFYTIQIPLRWSDVDGVIRGGTCTWTNQTAFSVNSATWTCDGPWMNIQKGGRYYSGVAGAGADVKNDGDGLKFLTPTGRYLNFT